MICSHHFRHIRARMVRGVELDGRADVQPCYIDSLDKL
jgi:hypothetical protein